MGTEMRTVALWVAVRGGLIALLPYCLGSILLYTRVRIENDAAYILWVKERVSQREEQMSFNKVIYPYHITPTKTIYTHSKHHYTPHTTPVRSLKTQPLRLRLLLPLRKPQTNTINAMPLIRRRLIPLPLEHMPQMPPAVITHNLRPLHPKRIICKPLHSTRNRVKVRGPAAAGLELVVGFV